MRQRGKQALQGRYSRVAMSGRKVISLRMPRSMKPGGDGEAEFGGGDAGGAEAGGSGGLDFDDADAGGAEKGGADFEAGYVVVIIHGKGVVSGCGNVVKSGFREFLEIRFGSVWEE